MANVLIPKKSTVAAKVPGVSDLALGEIAINHADAKLYARHPVSGTVQQIGGGDVTIDTTLADLLTATSGTLSADDPGADRLFFWDDSAGRATHLEVGTGLQISGTTLTATGTGSVSAIGTSAADVLSVSGSDIVADDPGADRLIFWDDSESKLTHLTLGTGLSLSGTTLSASASGLNTNTYLVFNAFNAQPPATAFATFDTRNSIAVLDFDDGPTNEATSFVSIIPEGANLTSGLKIRLHWMATSATTGVVRWGVQLERGNTDLDADSFDTAVEANTTTSATSGIPVVTEITTTSLDGLTAGDLFRLRVYRDSSDTTNDTMTGDAELITVEVRSAA